MYRQTLYATKQQPKLTIVEPGYMTKGPLEWSLTQWLKYLKNSKIGQN